MKSSKLILLLLGASALYLITKKKSGTTATYMPAPTSTLPTTQGTLTHGYNNLPNPFSNVQFPAPVIGPSLGPAPQLSAALTQWLSAMATQAQFNTFFQRQRPVKSSTRKGVTTKDYIIDANHVISITLDSHGGALDFALIKSAYPVIVTNGVTPPSWVAFFDNGPNAGPTTYQGTSQSII